ncbi:MAG: ABC transporter ATP-binding protein [Planctomycetota bacterium]|nr:ABC transporter ATP-binding protein [Planctomycetota bacterium]
MTTQTVRLEEEEYIGQLNLPVWKKVFGFAWPHKHYLAILVAVALTVAGIDAALPLITGALVDDAIRNGEKIQMWFWILAYSFLVLLAGVCFWAMIRLAGRVSTGISHDIRRAGFGHLQELSFSYYDRRPIGWLMARMTGDCDRLSRIISWGAVDIVWGGCTLIGVAVVMLVFNWRLALVVLAMIPPMIWLSVVFQKRLLPASRRVRRINSQITAAYSEAIMGVRTTKTLVREEENSHEFTGLTGEMFGASVHNAILAAMYFPMILSAGSIAGGLVLWQGGIEVLADPNKIGTLIVFISYAGLFMFPIHELARLFAEVQTAQAAAERITGLLDTEPEIKDSPEVRSAVERRSVAHPRSVLAIDGLADRIETVEFRNVSFAYKEGREVLKDFNLAVAPGQTIALVGSTGGGKSTIVSLLCRFYEPTSGEILINGVEYRRRSLHWLQSNLGIVLQTPHLFSGTIRENIRYGKLSADDGQIEWAAKVVNAHDFITEFEDGYDTEIGEGGTKLSTGQKQLVSFARAILADPQIFVMDEATSSVDTVTEQLIQKGLEKVLAGRISFVIAHRLSTIRSADRILVIEKGRVVEEGTHSELIRLKGEYYELYTNQYTEDRQAEILAGKTQR